MSSSPSREGGPTEFRVFTNDYEWVIARDVADAKAVWHEQTGGDLEDADEYEWDECPPESTMTVWCDADGDPAEPHEDGSNEVTKTFAEWAARGRGYLCTTEI